jgi:cation transport ATPase
VEPLRAGAVVLCVDGLRFLCDAACAARFRSGERAHDLPRAGAGLAVDARLDAAAHSLRAQAPAAQGLRAQAPAARGGPLLAEPLWSAPRDPEPRGGAPPSRPADDAVHVPGRIRLDEAMRATGRRAALVTTDGAPPPYVGLGAAAAGALLGLAGAHPAAAALSGVASLVATAIGTWRAAPQRRERMGLAWALPGAGAALAVIAGVWHALDAPEDAWAGLVGGAIAAASVAARPWLDARARAPIDGLGAQLLAALPSRARVARPQAGDTDGGRTAEVPLAQIRVSDELVATEGETLAADGVVVAGTASVLPHPGARTAAPRRPGDTVLAGARVVEGALRVAVARAGDDRAILRPKGFAAVDATASPTLARAASTAVRLGPPVAGVLAALSLLTSGGAASTRLAAAGAMLLALPLTSLLRAVTLPALAAAVAGAQRGFFYASPRLLERAGRSAVAVLCGHGAVTVGKPEVVEVHGFGGADDPAEVVALAAGVDASLASHAVSEAIRRYAAARGLTPTPSRRGAAIPGRGVTATAPSGERFVLGTRQFLLDEGVSVAIADGEAARAEARGRSVVFAALGGRVRALLVLEDELRPGARSAVQRLIDLGCEVVLLSGDHRPTVETLAKQLGIDHVRAELSPEERGAELRRLREGGPVVAAVGRPGHDEAVLSQADVAVGLGVAAGAAADRGVTVASEDVRDAADALWVARAARQETVRAAGLLAAAGLVLALGAAGGILAPGAVAALGLAVEGYALPAGLRLLRRMELRLPARA